MTECGRTESRKSNSRLGKGQVKATECDAQARSHSHTMHPQLTISGLGDSEPVLSKRAQLVLRWVFHRHGVDAVKLKMTSNFFLEATK